MQEKKNIGSLFDRIAGKYDTINHLFSLGIDTLWRKKAVATMRPAKHVLDVAIGTADFTIAMLKKGKAQYVTGIDLSQQMMNIGRTKVEKMNYLNQVDFQQISALDMPFEDNSFDAVTCSYGVRNFSNLDKGLQQMHRVLKEGGELIILEFSYPSNKLIAWCYDLYFSNIMPVVGRCLSRDKTAYTYLNQSVKHFIWGEAMCERLRKAGFQNPTSKTMTCGITTLYRAIK